MWYASTRNAGWYGYIRNEYPVPDEMNDAIKGLIAQGIKPCVSLWQSEYHGYDGSVELIEEDTLDTLYVHHSVGFGCDGEDRWSVSYFAENSEEIIVYQTK